MKKISKISAAVAIMLGLAAPALAGPQITFGPNDKGTLQLDYKGQFQLSVRDNGSGIDNNASTTSFDFRRNRIALMGAYGDNMSLYVQTEFMDKSAVGTLSVADETSDSNFQLLDAVVRFKLNDAINLNVGKFKYSFSRENLEACEAPLTLDRSLFIRAPYVTTRDMGVNVWGNMFNDVFQYRLDAMEGREAVSGASAPKSNLRYGARAHLSLLDPENTHGYKGTYLGKKSVLTVGAAYQYEPDVAYGINTSDTKDYKAWTTDIFFEYPTKSLGTMTLSAAYAKYDLDNAYIAATPSTGTIDLNGEKNGWYTKAGYMLPETPLQFFGRYEKWKFAQLNSINDEQVDWYGLGANYYIWGQNLKVTMEYSKTKFDKGSYADFSQFVTQLQVIF